MVTYFVVGGVALIIFLVWRLLVVSDERNDALAELRNLRSSCDKLIQGQGLQQEALRDLSEALGYAPAQQNDPSSE